MKIKFEKSSLLEGINIVTKAVAAKSPKPILECILIESAEDGCRLSCNNLNLGIETFVKATVLENGTVAVNASLFSGIIRKLPDSEISLETEDDYRTTIRCEKSVFSISCWDGEDFPEVTKIKKEKSIEISEMALRDVIRQTIFSISDNENNKIMTGEYFEVRGNVLTVVSLDGHRISVRKIPLKGENPDLEAIVPGKTLQDLSKIMNGGADDPVMVSFSGNSLCFEFGSTRVVSRLIEGEYFKIGRMLSMDTPIEVKANRQELMSCIDRATLLIQETDRKPVIFRIKNDNNLYIQLDTNIGSINEEMEIEKTGEEIVIGFNPSFLMEALRVIDDDRVNIYMKDSKSPCIIRDAEDTFSYIILPININTAVY